MCVLGLSCVKNEMMGAHTLYFGIFTE